MASARSGSDSTLEKTTRASSSSHGSVVEGITSVRSVSLHTQNLPDIYKFTQISRASDVGASQLIIDGKIKLKNDAQIASDLLERRSVINSSRTVSTAVEM